MIIGCLLLRLAVNGTEHGNAPWSGGSTLFVLEHIEQRRGMGRAARVFSVGQQTAGGYRVFEPIGVTTLRVPRLMVSGTAFSGSAGASGQRAANSS